MKLKLIIFEWDNKNKRFKEFKSDYMGNYALETMILKLLERYYSPKVMSEVQKILTNKVNGE
jgi:hypothetical protein